MAASTSHQSTSSLKASAGQGHKPSISPSRSNRVILFNLPEATLMETKSAIDEISEYLIGKKVNVRNAIRVGRRKPQADESGPTRPRPILITLESDWDKRLLLSKCRNLKEFPTHKKLFLRADLPPDHPQRGNRRSSETSHPDSHQSSQPQGASVPLNSALVSSNAKCTGSASGPSVTHHDQ